MDTLYHKYISIFAIFRITDITSSVLVGQGEPALLECAVDANPLNNHTIRWERKNYDMAGRTKTSMGSPTSMASSMLSSSSMVTSNSVNSLFGSQENVGVVMLTVLNATAEDSGEFWCVASNGLGGQIARNASFLLVRRKLFFLLMYDTTPISRYKLVHNIRKNDFSMGKAFDHFEHK